MHQPVVSNTYLSFKLLQLQHSHVQYNLLVHGFKVVIPTCHDVVSDDRKTFENEQS